MESVTLPPMTQDRSRLLGRALVGWSVLQLLLVLRGLRGTSWVLALPAVVLVGALSMLLAWAGVTLVVMDWDDPADYPPAACPPDPSEAASDSASAS